MPHVPAHTVTRRAALAAAVALGLAAAATPAFAAEKLRFAWSPAPQTPQIDIALAGKLFEKAGLDVEVVTFPSGREAFEALIGGQADVATMAELPAVVGALRKQPFAVIADLGRYNASRILTKAATGIAKPADLAGRRVGVTLGTNTDFALALTLETAGAAVERVNAGPADLIAALVRGDVDAIVPFPNFYAAAAKTLGADLREIPMPAYKGHFILAAGTSALKDRRAALEAFVGAVVEADKVLAADKPAAARVMAANLKGAIPEAALLAQWQDSDLAVKLDADLLALLLKEGAWVVKNGAVKAEAPTAASLAPYVDAAILAKVDPGRVALK